MKTRAFSLLFFAIFFTSSAYGELDLDQEVIIIPDTHNAKPYIWNVSRNPKDYELRLEYDGAEEKNDIQVKFSIVSESELRADDLHVFVTDEDIRFYRHIRPVLGNEGKYAFSLDAPLPGKYRVEVVFKKGEQWINLRKDIKIKGMRKSGIGDSKAGDEDYNVKVKFIPKKAYSEHVVTALFELRYKGMPLRGLEKIEGFDMQVASWDEDLKEFIFATPKQNLGGHEVAVSLVFMRPGRHAVFAEFKHKGVIRKIDFVLNVFEEPREDSGLLFQLKPAD